MMGGAMTTIGSTVRVGLGVCEYECMRLLQALQGGS